MIRAVNLAVRAGRHDLLRSVDLDVPTGSVTAIVGPNGSGKSTLLRALTRAVKLADGRVEIDGVDVRTRNRRWIARKLGYVGQRQEPDPSLTVAEEIGLGALAWSGGLLIGGRRLDVVVADALRTVGLQDRALSRTGVLSGGELQRVALARVLVQQSDHVLLDEPTNHLDPRHQLELLELLPRIADTAVVVLHDLDVAARVADHVVVLDRGRVAAAGPPSVVLDARVLDDVYRVRTRVHAPPDDHTHFSFSLPRGQQAPPAPPAGQPERNHP